MRVTARDNTGNVRPSSEVDEEIFRHAANAINEGYGVVLYAMEHSKTGLRSPSQECLDQLMGVYGDAIQIVMDACQARISRRRLQSFLLKGYFVLLTGSKFFTGPPLSGALLLPSGMSDAVPAHYWEVLGDYTCRADWSDTFAGAKSQLPARTNIGQLLRWSAALEEMRTYFNVPELVREIALRDAAAIMERTIQSHPNLQMLSVNSVSSDSADADEFAVRTIYSFIVKGRQRSPFTMGQSRILYRALNEDVSGILELRGHEARLAATPCHVGQPVALFNGSDGEVGALRISVDARTVCQFQRYQTSTLVQTLLDKLRLVTDQFEKVERIFRERNRGL